MVQNGAKKEKCKERNGAKKNSRAIPAPQIAQVPGRNVSRAIAQIITNMMRTKQRGSSQRLLLESVQIKQRYFHARGEKPSRPAEQTVA